MKIKGLDELVKENQQKSKRRKKIEKMKRDLEKEDRELLDQIQKNVKIIEKIKRKSG